MSVALSKTQYNVDWDLISLIFMICLLVGLFCWNKYYEGKQKRMIAFAIFFSLSAAYTILVNVKGPGGLFIVA